MGSGGMSGGGGGGGNPLRGGPGGFGNPQNYQQNFMQRFGLMGQQGSAGPGGYPQPLTSLFPMQQGGFPQQSGGLGGLAGLAGLGGPQTQQAAMNQNQQMLQQQGQGQLTPEAARQLFLQQSSPINQTTQADIMGQPGQPQPGYDRPLFETQMRQQQSLGGQNPTQQQQAFNQMLGMAAPATQAEADAQRKQQEQLIQQMGGQQAFDQMRMQSQQQYAPQSAGSFAVQKPAGPMPANPMAQPQQVSPENQRMSAMRAIQRLGGFR